MRVLVAIDGSEFSEAVINEVTSRAWPANSEIRVITAFELPLAPTPEVWALPPEYSERLDRAACGQAEGGPPRSVILEEAERWNADLIVIGSHGYGAWQRFLMGSVSQAVVSHARCSVEVVRRREQNTEAKAA